MAEKITYPTRCQIIDPEGLFMGPNPLKAPEASKPHIGKKGTASYKGKGKGRVRIVLDDGTELDGLDCWWTPINEPVPANAG